MALITKHIDEKTAEEVVDANDDNPNLIEEYGSENVIFPYDYDLADNYVDLQNNRIGRRIGANYMENISLLYEYGFDSKYKTMQPFRCRSLVT